MLFIRGRLSVAPVQVQRFSRAGVVRRGLSAAASPDNSSEGNDKPAETKAAPQAVEAKPKRQYKDSEKRYQAKKAALARKQKTALCPVHIAGGKCENAKCQYAHGVAELKSPVYFKQAEEAAAKEGRPISANDLLHAKMSEIFRRDSGFKAAINGLQVETNCVTVVEWSQKKLDLVRLVEKATITVPINSLSNNWNLTPSQVTLLKQVVGPRYKPETDSFKLVKRNRKPYTEIADEETVYDPLIRKLYEVVREVKAVASEPYSDAQYVAPIVRQPKVAIRLATVENA